MQTSSPAVPANARALIGSLWGFAFLSYLLRTNIAVAQQYMARDLHLNTTQVGYLFTAFLLGYTIFQVPAGFLGDRFGPRIVLTVCGFAWSVTTFLTGALPGLLVSSLAGSVAAVLMVRFAHGLEEAATYPVAMTAVSDWFPPADHAFITALIFTGSTLGSAFAPPLVAYLMTGFGWRTTFYVTAAFPLALTAVWWRRTAGLEHRRPAPLGSRQVPARGWLSLIGRRALAALCASYLLYCYSISIFVYWLFKYLVDVRRLSVVGSGWATGVPWVFASVAVPVSGYASRRLSARIGNLQGRRLIATACLAAAAVLMFVVARASRTEVALAAIALSIGLLFSTESSYWSTAIELAPVDSGAASGWMNFAGNLGGVLSTLLVPLLVQWLGWFFALLSGSLFAVAAAGCWFVLPGHAEAPETLSYTENLPRGLA